jgi:hypothetical protein
MPSRKNQAGTPRATRATARTPAPPAGGVYSGLLTEEELHALRSLGDGTLRDEIALLRVLVRRELEAGGTAESIRRLIREIGQTVKVERSAGASAGDAIQLALDDLLTEVSEGTTDGTIAQRRRDAEV